MRKRDDADAAWNDLAVSPATFFEPITSLDLRNRIRFPLGGAFTLSPIEQLTRWGEELPQAELVGQLLLLDAGEVLRIRGLGCGALAQLTSAVKVIDVVDNRDLDADEIARRARALAHLIRELMTYAPVSRLRVLAFNARRRGSSADFEVYLQAAELVQRTVTRA